MKAILKINGKEIEVEVSEKQLGKLTEKKNPFARKRNGMFFLINHDGDILKLTDYESRTENDLYDVANYCTDKDLIQQQAWRETLNRLLWRWQYENDEAVDWRKRTDKFSIYYICDAECFDVTYDIRCKSQGLVHFSTEEKAKQAIEEVVKPFMKEHPDFVW